MSEQSGEVPETLREPSEAQIDAAEAWYFGDAHPPMRALMRPFIRGMARAILNTGAALERPRPFEGGTDQ